MKKEVDNLHDVKQIGGISILSNPVVSDVLSIDLNVLDKGRYNVHIVNAQGQDVESLEVFIEDSNSNSNLDLLISGLENGLHTVVFSDVDGRVFSKIFLKNK